MYLGRNENQACMYFRPNKITYSRHLLYVDIFTYNTYFSSQTTFKIVNIIFKNEFPGAALGNNKE